MKYQTLRVSALAGTAALGFFPAAARSAVVDFEAFPLGGDGYWNGSDGGTLADAGATFHTNYNTMYGSWSGFSVSSHTDSATAGFSNQYSAFPGGGASGSAQYAVGYYASYEMSTVVTLGALTNLAGTGASFTNTTYTALSMRDGGIFGDKKFGGASGSDPDFFLLTIEGYSAGLPTGGHVEFYLADFRFADSSDDYILSDWAYVDFTPLGSADELRFQLSSSDNGIYGMNTPAYFAMDNFTAVPEPSSLLAFACGAGFVLRRKR